VRGRRSHFVGVGPPTASRALRPCSQVFGETGGAPGPSPAGLERADPVRLDSVSNGPREVDLIPTWHAAARYGRDETWIQAFVAEYGYDLRDWGRIRHPAQDARPRPDPWPASPISEPASCRGAPSTVDRDPVRWPRRYLGGALTGRRDEAVRVTQSC
jgi:hypothetical protein